MLLIGIATASLLALWRDRLRALACVAGPLIAVYVTERTAKPLVGRHVTPFGGFSYPSGTTTAATTIAVAGVLVLPRLLRPLGAVLGLGVVVAVGCAVVVLRWHFPTDAAGGALVGAGFVLAVDGGLHLLAPALRARKRTRPGPSR